MKNEVNTKIGNSEGWYDKIIVGDKVCKYYNGGLYSDFDDEIGIFDGEGVE